MGTREEELKPEQIQKWERVQNRVRKIAEMDAGQRAMEILRGDRVWIVRLVWLLERDQQLAKEEAILSEREATADDYVGRAMEEMQQQNVDRLQAVEGGAQAGRGGAAQAGEGAAAADTGGIRKGGSGAGGKGEDAPEAGTGDSKGGAGV